MKRLFILVLIVILTTSCSKHQECSIVLNDRTIQSLVADTEGTKIKIGDKFEVGDLEVTINEVKFVEDASNHGSVYHLIVELAAFHNGEGKCKMSEAINVAMYSKDKSIQYENTCSEFKGLRGTGQRIIYGMNIISQKSTSAAVTFGVDKDIMKTKNFRIYLLVSNELFMVDIN